MIFPILQNTASVVCQGLGLHSRKCFRECHYQDTEPSQQCYEAELKMDWNVLDMNKISAYKKIAKLAAARDHIGNVLVVNPSVAKDMENEICHLNEIVNKLKRLCAKIAGKS